MWVTTKAEVLQACPEIKQQATFLLLVHNRLYSYYGFKKWLIKIRHNGECILLHSYDHEVNMWNSLELYAHVKQNLNFSFGVVGCNICCFFFFFLQHWVKHTWGFSISVPLQGSRGDLWAQTLILLILNVTIVLPLKWSFSASHTHNANQIMFHSNTFWLLTVQISGIVKQTWRCPE